MGSFSILNWGVVLAIIGIIAFAISQGLRRESTRPSELKGIGGWLALLAVAQVLGLCQLVLGFFQNFEAYGSLPVGYPLAVRIAIYAEIATGIGYIILAGVTTMALFKKKKYFTELFICQWLTFPALLILNSAVVTFAVGIPWSEVITTEEIAAAFGAFGWGGVWVWYTQVSKRVANTMVN